MDWFRKQLMKLRGKHICHEGHMVETSDGFWCMYCGRYKEVS